MSEKPPRNPGKKRISFVIFEKWCIVLTLIISFTEQIIMTLELLKGKIHRARLTACDLNYEGSLEIGRAHV